MKKCSNVLHDDCIEEVGRCYVCNGTKKRKYYRNDYNDFEWFELMKSLDENLPDDYHNIFDIHGEVLEKYDHIFNVDIFYTKRGRKQYERKMSNV